MNGNIRLYRVLWKELLRSAPGTGEAAQIDADGLCIREHDLRELFEWVEHKAGSVSDYTLVFNPECYEPVCESLESNHWTGDSGRFDSAETAGFPDIDGLAMQRPDPGIPPGCMALVELDAVRLDGTIESFEHDRDGDVDAHPYSTIVNAHGNWFGESDGE